VRKTASSTAALRAIAIEHFETEVLHQWDFVQRGAALMESGLRSDLNDFWFGLHATISALGNISKVFFPSRTSNPRCARMRRLYNVSDKSLLGDRKVRNGLEHFDERVDKWAATSKQHNFADRNVFTAGMIVGLDAGDFARNYDPASTVITVFGETVDLGGLITETRAIVGRVHAAQQKRYAARFGLRTR
jgi:hypothetical protein